MKFINTPEDVELRPYMKGEEKFNYSVCPTCQRLEKKPVGGNPRCQGVKKAKRLKTTEGDILLAEHWVQCESRASTEIDSKWYCGIHAKNIGDKK